jgi:DinB superfamily
MDARQLLLADHARIHSRAATGSADLSLEDGLCDGPTDEQLRGRPSAGLNPVAWLLWHLTRIEDVTVNRLVRGIPEVLDRGGWLDRLGVESRHVGTGSDDDEVGDFSERVDLVALRAYRAVVGRETRAWLAAVDLDTLEAVPEAEERLAAAPAAIAERGAWLRGFWTGKTGCGSCPSR